MKNLLSLALFVLLLCVNIDSYAQKEAPIKHKKYDVRNYVYRNTDPYNPLAIGFVSSAIPGLGQMVCGVPEKGVSFLLASTSGWIVTITGVIPLFQTTYPEPNWHDVKEVAHRKMAIGLSISAISWIWSIIDAPRTAKIQNMKYRETKGMTGNISVVPYFTRVSSYPNKKGDALGISFNINF